MTNPFRPGRPASLLDNGEAQKACRAEGLCAKATAGVESGGWGRNAQKAKHVKQRDPRGSKPAG